MTSSLRWPVLIHLWLYTAWRQRYLIVTLIVLFPVLGLVIGVLSPKVFESRMTVLIQEAARHNPFLEDLAVQTRVKDRINALDALLHSRHVLLGVVVDLKRIDEQTSPKDREDILRELSESLRLRLIGDELVELSYKQPDSADIDTVLIAVAQRFMEKVLAPERSSITGSLRFLEEQLAQGTEQLAAAEAALSAFTSENANNLPDLHAGNVRRLADLRMSLTERRTELESAEVNYQSVKQRLSQSNPVITGIEQQIVRITTELATLRSRYTDAHSAVQAAERKLGRLREERNALLTNTPVLSDAEIEAVWTSALRTTDSDNGFGNLLISQLEKLQQARTRVVDLGRQVTALEKGVVSFDNLVWKVGAMESKLQHLRRELKVKSDVYNKLTERVEMARLTGALGRFEAPERVKIIDEPTVPSRPSSLPLIIYVLAGLMAGCSAAVGAVVLSEVTDSTLRRRDQVQAVTGVPVVTRVPSLPDLDAEIATILNQGSSPKTSLTPVTQEA